MDLLHEFEERYLLTTLVSKVKNAPVIKPGLALLVIFLLLPACQSSSEPRMDLDNLPSVSAVAVSQSGFAIKPGETVRWRSEVLWVGDDSLENYRRVLTQLNIQQEVERQLQQHGLQFVDNAQANYALTGAVMIGETPEGVALEELARLHPSLKPLSLTLEKGTLLLALSHPSSPVILWRGAVQTFISPEIPLEQRQQRLEAVVRSLVNTLP